MSLMMAAMGALKTVQVTRKVGVGEQGMATCPLATVNLLMRVLKHSKIVLMTELKKCDSDKRNDIIANNGNGSRRRRRPAMQ